MKTFQEIQYEVETLPPNKLGDYASNLADKFRSRFEADLLVSMLSVDSEKLLSIAAWIAGEVVDVTSERILLAPIARLLSHPNPEIRFEVIKPALALATPTDAFLVCSILRLLGDSEVSVRCRALRVACFADDELIGDEVLSQIPKAAIMLKGCERAALYDALESGELLASQFAIAGLMKHRSSDEELLELARRQFADDIRVFDSLPKGARYTS